MTDTTTTPTGGKTQNPQQACSVCGSSAHTAGYHDNAEPTGYHDNSVPTDNE